MNYYNFINLDLAMEGSAPLIGRELMVNIVFLTSYSELTLHLQSSRSNQPSLLSSKKNQKSAMSSLSLAFNSFAICPKIHPTSTLLRPKTPITLSSSTSKLRYLPTIRCARQSPDILPVDPVIKPRLELFLSTAASLYPLYVTAGGLLACWKPSAFDWFVQGAPLSYSLSLGFIMLTMGLTLELKDFFQLFVDRPFSVSLLPVHPILFVFYFS